MRRPAPFRTLLSLFVLLIAVAVVGTAQDDPLRNWGTSAGGDLPQGPSGNRRNDGSQRPKRIFFPPDPPPLGATINFGRRHPRRGSAPQLLAPHVMEPYYAPLSTWLAEVLDPTQEKLRPRLDAYARDRDALLRELRDTLERTDQANPADREETLAALATHQAAALVRLESEAEDLRQYLARAASWYSLRGWKLGRGPLSVHRPEHRLLEFELIRAAAFYQEGLSPAQRRLLREAAMQMQDEIFPRTGREDNAPEAPALLFFSPDLARLLPAMDYPPAVAALLVEFDRKKAAIRDELVAAVIDADRAVFASSRQQPLEHLAASQAPRLGALDTAADEIRQAHAPAWERTRRARPAALPPDLVAQIETCLARRRDLQGRYDDAIAEIRRHLVRESAGQQAQDINARITAETTAYATEFSQLHADDMAAIRTLADAIIPRLTTLGGPEAASAPGNGAGFIEAVMRERHEAIAYYEYEVAVWQRGLSPAQRRLLFNGAMVELGLLLPGAELQPTRLPATLLPAPTR